MSVVAMSFAGMPVRRSWLMRDELHVSNGRLILHPWFSLERAEYRPPFYTSMCVGVREAERDRRRRARLASSGVHNDRRM